MGTTPMNVEGRDVLITGANRGLGSALVQEALRRGARRVYASTRGRSGPRCSSPGTCKGLADARGLGIRFVALAPRQLLAGTVIGVLGTALATSPIGLVLVAILGGYFYYCASVEERNLATAFPEAYPAYRARTRMLVPFVL